MAETRDPRARDNDMHRRQGLLAFLHLRLRDMHMPGKPREERAERPCPQDKTVDGLITLQMSRGGLLDGRPADGYQVHLVRHVRGGGTPEPTLCGIDRFAKDGPAWSVGGGLSGPGVVHTPCTDCAAAAGRSSRAWRSPAQALRRWRPCSRCGGRAGTGGNA